LVLAVQGPAPRAVVIVEDGVDDLELYYSVYRLREAGYSVTVVSHARESNVVVYDEATGSLKRAPRKVRGKYGLEHDVDATYEEALNMDFQVLVVPGGRSPERARLHRSAVELVKKAAERGALIIAICHGPLLLASAGLLAGRRVTGHPGIGDDLRAAGAEYTGAPAEKDGNIVTVRHTTTIHEGFKLALAEGNK